MAQFPRTDSAHTLHSHPTLRLCHASQELHHQHRPHHSQHTGGVAGEACRAGGRVASCNRGAVLLPSHRGGRHPVHLQPAGTLRGGRVVAPRSPRGQAPPKYHTSGTSHCTHLSASFCHDTCLASSVSRLFCVAVELPMQ